MPDVKEIQSGFTDQTNENQNDYYTDDGNADFKNCIPKWKIKEKITTRENKITNQIYENEERQKKIEEEYELL